jgi:predicted DNA-binding transcriptional regulator YafY
MIQSSFGPLGMNRSAAVTRQVRTLRILNCLQSGPAFNARELSGMLKVSERTIYRDIGLIRAAGIEINYDGEQGAYRIVTERTPVLNAMQLSPDDVAKVVMAAHFSFLQAFPGFAESSRELLARAMTHHSPGIQNGISRMLNACTIEANPCGSVDVIEEFLLAIRNQQWLRVKYNLDKANTHEWMRFAPYHLVASQAGPWRAEGKSTSHGCLVNLPLDRVGFCDVTSDRFRIPRSYRNRARMDQSEAALSIDEANREKPAQRRRGRAKLAKQGKRTWQAQ